MALARRLMTKNVDRRVKDNDNQKITTKSKRMQTGSQRTVLEDIGNVTKECTKDKPLAKQKEDNFLDTKRKAFRHNENIPPIGESTDVNGMILHCGVLSIAETEQESKIIPGKHPDNVTDIDKESENDPYQCSEYANDIFIYLASREKKLQVDDYMHSQTEINERMRSILVDWLVQVHGRFGLLQETLYLTVNIIDRFLQHHSISRSKLQLLGVTAMLVASKFEETYAPEIGDFVYITDNSYCKGQMKKMEHLILKTIKYDLSTPLCLHFLRRNSKAAQADAKRHTLAKYFMELTLVDYKMARLLPSEIAAASLCLAGKIIDDSPWTKTLEYYSMYCQSDLQTTMKGIANLVLRTESSKLQAVKSKYANNKFMRVSSFQELKGDALMKFAKS